MSLIDLLARLSTIEGKIQDVLSRVPALQIATVTDNRDPSGYRKIKVTREVQGSQSETDWIQAGRNTRFADEPLPKIGDTVMIGAVDGNPHDLYYIRNLTNDTNPPTEQSDPVEDNTREILGDETVKILGEVNEKIGKNQNTEIDGKYTLSVNGGEITIESNFGIVTITADETITLSNSSGAMIQLLANGKIIIQDGFGKKLSLGASNSFDLGNSDLSIINASNLSINGKSVATIGAQDSRGDTLTTRGW